MNYVFCQFCVYFEQHYKFKNFEVIKTNCGECKLSPLKKYDNKDCSDFTLNNCIGEEIHENVILSLSRISKNIQIIRSLIEDEKNL